MSLFDHLVGARQQRFRDCEADRLGGREIDDEIKFGRLFDRYITRLRPAQNCVDQIGSAPEQSRPPAWTNSRWLKIVGSRAPSASVMIRMRLAATNASTAT